MNQMNMNMNNMNLMNLMNNMNNQMTMGGNGMNMGMNNQMTMGGNGMNMGMNAEQMKQWKQQQLMFGYYMGKMLANQNKKQGNNNDKKNESKDNGPSGPQSDSEITIKFKKGDKVTDIKAKPNAMVAELLNDYFEKENVKTGTFKFNNITLNPGDSGEIHEIGLKNGDIINVS